MCSFRTYLQMPDCFQGCKSRPRWEASPWGSCPSDAGKGVVFIYLLLTTVRPRDTPGAWRHWAFLPGERLRQHPGALDLQRELPTHPGQALFQHVVLRLPWLGSNVRGAALPRSKPRAAVCARGVAAGGPGPGGLPCLPGMAVSYPLAVG